MNFYCVNVVYYIIVVILLLSYISRYKYNFIHFVYDNNQIRTNVSYEITLLPLYTDCIQSCYYDNVHTASHLLINQYIIILLQSRRWLRTINLL